MQGERDVDVLSSPSQEVLEANQDSEILVCLLLVKSVLLVKMREANNFWLLMKSTCQNGSNAAKLRKCPKGLQKIGSFVEFKRLLALACESNLPALCNFDEALHLVEFQIKPLMRQLVESSSKELVKELLWPGAVEGWAWDVTYSKINDSTQAVLESHPAARELLRQHFSALSPGRFNCS